jgi:hypothetical protein
MGDLLYDWHVEACVLLVSIRVLLVWIWNMRSINDRMTYLALSCM